jgi:hypothetical protein
MVKATPKTPWILEVQAGGYGGTGFRQGSDTIEVER